MKKIVLISILSTIWLAIAGAQDSMSYPIDRYQNTEYKTFRHYLAGNLQFQIEAFENPGILLPGLILDSLGDIVQVFSLNSLHPSIDNSVLDLFELSEGNWLPELKPNSNQDIFIVPIRFHFEGVESRIDTNNIRYQIYDEIVVTAINVEMVDYTRTNILIKKYDRYISKKQYDKAKSVITDLLKREPLNYNYYIELLNIAISQDDKKLVNQIESFIKSVYREYPEIKDYENISGQ